MLEPLSQCYALPAPLSGEPYPLHLHEADTARRVPTMHAKHLASCAQLEQPDGATVLKSFRFCTMLFVFALETVQKPPFFSTNTAFHLKLVHSPVCDDKNIQVIDIKSITAWCNRLVESECEMNGLGILLIVVTSGYRVDKRACRTFHQCMCIVE